MPRVKKEEQFDVYREVRRVLKDSGYIFTGGAGARTESYYNSQTQTEIRATLYEEVTEPSNEVKLTVFKLHEERDKDYIRGLVDSAVHQTQI